MWTRTRTEEMGCKRKKGETLKRKRTDVCAEEEEKEKGDEEEEEEGPVCSYVLQDIFHFGAAARKEKKEGERVRRKKREGEE